MISYIIPTHNRAEALAQTLRALGSLPAHAAEVVLVDNASDVPAAAPLLLENGIPVEVIFRKKNEGAAGRNAGAHAADRSSEWLVMLDDDSCPTDVSFLSTLHGQPPDVGAVAAEVFLGTQRQEPEEHRERQGGKAAGWQVNPARESGGLPEVFIGCGVAIRREAFLSCGGYDASFGYYAEEYDLAARLLLSGMRVTLDRRFRVVHRKVAHGRDMNTILRRLVRNNGWVAQRYSPAPHRRAELRGVLARYAPIASREQSLPGYAAGAAELLLTLHRQRRTPLKSELFDRFTGLAEARRSIGAVYGKRPFRSACIVDPGKNARFVRRALVQHGVRIVEDRGSAEALVIGTLSPGPLLDSWERWGLRGNRPPLVSAWGSLTCNAEAATRADAAAP